MQKREWLLVRTTKTGQLFVLDRRTFDYFQSLNQAYRDNEVVAESDNHKELERFRALAEEN